MRRGEREVTDKNEIFEILSSCQVVRVAFFDDKYPYIIPLSFGAEMKGETVAVYFHCANEGKKVKLIEKNNRVCVEADVFDGYCGEGMQITTLYKSVIGFGKAQKCDDDEKVKGLRLLMEHCGYSPTDEMLKTCASFEKVAIYKITLDSVTGKKNPID